MPPSTIQAGAWRNQPAYTAVPASTALISRYHPMPLRGVRVTPRRFTMIQESPAPVTPISIEPPSVVCVIGLPLSAASSKSHRDRREGGQGHGKREVLGDPHQPKLGEREFHQHHQDADDKELQSRDH